jgi:hypothetical protein
MFDTYGNGGRRVPIGWQEVVPTEGTPAARSTAESGSSRSRCRASPGWPAGGGGAPSSADRCDTDRWPGRALLSTLATQCSTSRTGRLGRLHQQVSAQPQLTAPMPSTKRPMTAKSTYRPNTHRKTRRVIFTSDGSHIVALQAQHARVITPMFDARRCTRACSVEGLGGGPAGRFPRSRMILSWLSGWAAPAAVRGYRGRRT